MLYVAGSNLILTGMLLGCVGLFLYDLVQLRTTLYACVCRQYWMPWDSIGRTKRCKFPAGNDRFLCDF